jgi:hypothetical protein
MSWPEIVDEQNTLAALLDTGSSIARFGDGEFKLIAGFDQMREPRNKKLGRELKDVLQNQREKLLVGIPTLDPKGPKYLNWRYRAAQRFGRYVAPGVNNGMRYFSAFITRPDSAPWIYSREYAEHFVRLWKDKFPILVSEPDTAIYRLLERTASAGTFGFVACPHSETYKELDDIEHRVRQRAGAETQRACVALLSCGPAATCLSARLSGTMQAIDVGSAGGFLLRLLFGKGNDDDDRTGKE